MRIATDRDLATGIPADVQESRDRLHRCPPVLDFRVVQLQRCPVGLGGHGQPLEVNREVLIHRMRDQIHPGIHPQRVDQYLGPVRAAAPALESHMEPQEHDVQVRQHPPRDIRCPAFLGHVRLDAFQVADPRHRLVHPVIDRAGMPASERRTVVRDRQSRHSPFPGCRQHFNMRMNTALAHQRMRMEIHLDHHAPLGSRSIVEHAAADVLAQD